MIKIIASLIAITVEITIIILAVIWYMNTKEIEPLCVGVAASGALIGSILVRCFAPSESNGTLDIEEVASTMGKVDVLKKGSLRNEKINIKNVSGMNDVNIEIKDE